MIPLKVLSIIFFSLFSSTARADGESCFLPILHAISPPLFRAYDGFIKINPALIRGEMTPRWADFDQLQKILSDAKLGKKTLLDAGRTKDLEDAFAEIQKTFSGEALADQLKNGKGGKVSNVYRPTEYELKREYQSLLWELNRELPKNLKIPGVRIPFDARIPKVIADAKELVKRQEKWFSTIFPSFGYKNMKEFHDALNAHSELSKKLLKMFEIEDLEVAMNRPEGARWWTPKVGFQNQRITGTSRETFNNDLRNRAEAKMVNMDLQTYSDLDDQLKPTYGYLKPKPESGFIQSEDANQYGTDIYIFKKAKVTDRLTWTSGDSLGGHDYFIPWKDRDLVIPDVLDRIELDNYAFSAAPPSIPLPKPPVMPEIGLKNHLPHPSYPRLELPLAPKTPVAKGILPLPEPPVYPPYPEQPKVPLMPPLEKGQSFDTALVKFKMTPEYLSYQEAVKTIQDQYPKNVAAFNTSPAYLEYQKKLAEVKAKNDAINVEFFKTKEYLDFQAEYKVYQDLVQQKRAEYNTSPEMLRYQEDLKKFNEADLAIEISNATILKEFDASPTGVEYNAQKTKYNQDLNAFRASDDYRWKQFNLQSDPYFLWRGTPLEKFTKKMNGGYIELQYWGPTTLDDVEAFEFKGNPPSGEFLQELLQRGIKIRDGRVQPAVEWKP